MRGKNADGEWVDGHTIIGSDNTGPIITSVRPLANTCPICGQKEVTPQERERLQAEAKLLKCPVCQEVYKQGKYCTTDGAKLTNQSRGF
jgi:predicted RNA-binding Zn-ribbon protein involved in translation (DUF1610 family)